MRKAITDTKRILLQSQRATHNLPLNFIDNPSVDAHVAQRYVVDILYDVRLGHIIEGAVLEQNVCDGRAAEATQVERILAPLAGHVADSDVANDGGEAAFLAFLV